MKLQELLAKAEWERVEMRAKRDAEQAEKARAEAAELAAHDAAFRAWLGDLAGDFEISEPWWDGNGDPVWRLRPRAWRIGWEIGVGGEKSGYTFAFSGLGNAYAATADNSPALAQFLLNAQQAHDDEVAKRVMRHERSLATARDAGCADDESRLRQVRDALETLAPERAAEWDALLGKSLDALEAWRAEQAEKVAVRAAAVERFGEAMEAWADECAAVRAHNDDVRAGLLADLGDVKQDVIQVEYAVVAASDEYRPLVETHRAFAVGIVAGSDDRTFLVIDNGRIREWTFRNLVGYSEPVMVRPSENPELFASAWIGDGEGQAFYFPGDVLHQRRVDAARRAIRTFPDEPSWADFGDGLEWGLDVGRVVTASRERAGAE